MSWIGFLPLLLIASLALVLFPILAKNGNRPLPVGLEDDGRLDLENRRLVLLGQLKEMNLAEGNTQALAQGRAGLEAELAEVFGQLDAMSPQTTPRDISLPEGSTKAGGVDKGFAAAFVLFAATLSTLLYVLMGTTQKIDVPAAPPAESAAEMNQLLDQAIKRLEQDPGNLAGWMRLARSFVVMQRVQEAVQAYTFIIKNHPREVEPRVALAELKVQNGESEADISEGTGMFKAILAQNPNNQDALWFLGGLAMRAGSNDEAVGYWQRLLDTLPPDDPNRQMVQKALTDLQKQKN
ncbi:MAG: TPR repeat-containing protein [Magnetococcales bacterium]|nr:TPR repeat-containing protein [Magnetococcales bacterium]